MSNDYAPPEHNQLVLSQAQLVLQPLIAWLLRSGVDFGEFSNAAKVVFLEEAQKELRRTHQKETDSSVSVLSGLHRQSVKEWRNATDELRANAHRLGRPSLASQVVTRWLYEAQQQSKKITAEDPQSADGSFQRPLSGQGSSFEALAQSVSRDVHPRTVLNELKRLNLVEEFTDSSSLEMVRLVKESFSPSAQQKEIIELLTGAVSDHFWTGVQNITGDAEKQLEQSVFADGLTEESIQVLSEFSHELWQDVFQKIVKLAATRVEIDGTKNGTQRMRLGMYFFASEPSPTVVAPETTVNKERP